MDEFTPNGEGNPNPNTETVTIPVTKATKVIGLILGLAAIIVPSGAYIDGRYAKASDVQQLQQELRQGLTANEIQGLRIQRSGLDSEVFRLEQLEKRGQLDQEGAIRLRELRHQLKEIDRQIGELYRK